MADYSANAVDSSVSAVSFSLLFGVGDRNGDRDGTDAGSVNLGLLFGVGDRDADRNGLDAGNVNLGLLFSVGDREADRNGFLEVSGLPISGVRTADRNVSRPIVITAAYYLMRAIDPDAQTLTYRTWVVSGNPDTSGAQYVGTRSGVSALTDIVIAATWTV